MPYAIFDYMGGVLPMWTMVSLWSKQAHGCSCQGCKATNHTGTFQNLRNPATPTGQSCLRNLHQHIRLRNLPRPSAPTHASTHRNPPKSSGAFRNWPPEPDLHHFTPELSGTFRNLPRTYTGIRRNSPEPSGTCLRNLHQHTPELSGTFRNPSPEPTPAYAGTFRNLSELASRRNSPEPSRTRLRNLHQHTPELSGTFRNPPAEPTAAHHRTLWNLPEPSSGTCSCDPHRHTPELIWAEDPISLRCWGKNVNAQKKGRKKHVSLQRPDLAIKIMLWFSA